MAGKGIKFAVSLLFTLLLVEPGHGFVPPKGRPSFWLSPPSQPCTVRHQTPRSLSCLFMANVTVPILENKNSATQQTNPLQPLVEFWESFATSSAFRTLLFTGALFSSKAVRNFLGVPGCSAIALTAFSIYYYETKFNYLVDVVTPRRQAALKALRQWKTEQLSSSSKSSDTNMQALLDAYEKCLREELNTRVIVPNLWVIEMDQSQEDRSAAPQFLGLEITENYTLEPVNDSKRIQ